MTEAERGVAALHFGARVALAIAILVFVGVAYQTDAVAPDLASPPSRWASPWLSPPASNTSGELGASAVRAS